MTVGLEPPLEEPLWLLLLRRDDANDVFAQSLGYCVGFDVGEEAVGVLLVDELLDSIDGSTHAPFLPISSG
jgi:hypothetical protein